MTPMRKILELIIYCKKIAEECDKASASHDDQSKRNWKKSRQKKATQRMSDNKPRRLQLKPEKKKKTKKNTKMTILGANETMAQKPWDLIEGY